MDSYGSHVLALGPILSKCRGPIIELGMGHYSTTMLNIHSLLNSSLVLSVETNADWYNQFRDLNSETHTLKLVNSYDDVDLESSKWDIAFIDHAPCPRRVIDATRLRFSASIILMHDTEQANSKDYTWELLWDKFKYRYDFKRYTPWTSVVSNDHDRFHEVLGKLITP
jgi:hypothetical protein